MNWQDTIGYSDEGKTDADKKKGRAQEIDKLIGQQLKKFRKLRKMTQEDLAAKLGISFQQIQKYENGKNRITFGRLYELSNFLNVPLSSFVAGIDDPQTLAQTSDMTDNNQSNIAGYDENAVTQKETDALLKVYYSLEDPKLRKSLLKLVKSMAENMKN